MQFWAYNNLPTRSRRAQTKRRPDRSPNSSLLRSSTHFLSVLAGSRLFAGNLCDTLTSLSNMADSQQRKLCWLANIYIYIYFLHFLPDNVTPWRVARQAPVISKKGKICCSQWIKNSTNPTLDCLDCQTKAIKKFIIHAISTKWGFPSIHIECE